MASIPASQPPGADFTARKWLADWSANGGIYILTGDHLYLRRARPLDAQSTRNLDLLRDHLLRSGGGPAIANVLIRRRNGDVR